MQKNQSKPRKKRTSSGTFLKIIVLGDSNVGKTTLINRYVRGFYQDSLTTTLGIDFKIKRLEANGEKMNLQIWDTAGQEKFKTLTKSYFQGCMGVVIAFSLLDRSSFENINQWINSLHEILPSEIPKILVGTKIDCFEERQISIEECSQFTFASDLEYFQISSKTGYNIDNVFSSLADKIIKGQKKVGMSHFSQNQFYQNQSNSQAKKISLFQQFQKSDCKC